MTEEGTAVGRQESRKFFSKSKWRGKHDEGLVKGSNQKQANKEQDVLDFLKPSTEKAALNVPRIDVAAAQRWPGATAVGKSHSPERTIPSSMRGKPGQRPRMTKALTVAFVRAAPEIIGEGGDEAETPAIEVSRRRGLNVYQGASDAAAHRDDSVVGMRSPRFHEGMETRAQDSSGDGRPVFRRRAQTSGGELSPTLQGKLDTQKPSPPSGPAPGDGLGFRPSPLKRVQTGQQGGGDGISGPSLDSTDFEPKQLKRTQTGYSDIVPPDDDRTPRLPRVDPLENHLLDLNNHASHFLETEVTNPDSLAAKVQHKMRAEEGRALHEGFHHMQDSSPESSRPSTDSNPFSSSPDSYRRPPTSGRTSLESPVKHGKAPFSYPNSDQHKSIPPQLSYENYGPSSGRLPHQQAAYSDSPPVQQRVQQEDSLPGKSSLSQNNPYYNSQAKQRTPQETIGLQSRTQPPQSSSHLNVDNQYRPSSSSSQYSLTPQRQPSPGTSLRQKPSGQSTPRGTPNPPSLTPGQPFEQLLKSPAPILGQDPSLHRLDQDLGLHLTTPSEQRMDPRDARDAAFEDFADRVVHMKGIFRLTAELERPLTTYTPMQWLRASMWWFLRGRAGLESLIRSRARSGDGQRDQLLTQPHVDLAKTWWILTDVTPNHPGMRAYADPRADSQAPAARSAGDHAMAEIYETYDMILANLKALLFSMDRNQVMPPEQALIQGQDQSIWIKYPPFAADVQSLLAGKSSKSLIADGPARTPNPIIYMPLADSKDQFCYGRMFVQVSLSTEDAETDRLPLPCVLSILRARDDWQVKVAICSQSELVNLCIQHNKNLGPTWDDVKWKTRARGLYVRLPRGFTLNIELSENDYRQLWGIYDYTNKVQASFQTRDDERLMHEVTLKEFQYTDPTNPQAFPAERVKRCRAFIYEKFITRNEGTGERHLHRGYRVLVVTSPKNKTLSSISHELGSQRPIHFEFKADPGSENTPSIVLRIKEEKKQCIMYMVFHDAHERKDLFSVLNGMKLTPDETVFANVPLKSLSIEQADPAEGFSHSGHDVPKRLQWQDIMTFNLDPENGSSEFPLTILSENLRIVARHAAGSFTDRLNMSPGEFRIRLDTSGNAELHVLRQPQEDMTIATDVRRAEQGIADALAELLNTIIQNPTIRKYNFQNLDDLHAFQFAITGFHVKFDGVASTFAISRRRMVVPIYKKWEASGVRIQVVQQESVIQLLAFFEDFSHAECMNFQLKGMDVFEKVDRSGKSCVKLVDAKFALPEELRKGETRSVARRFVCLDLPEYPGEHDDITVGFDSVTERDRFSAALPATTQVGRSLTLRRKI